MPKTTRKPKNELEARVTELYQEPDGSLPDMKHIERKNRGGGFFVVFIVCLFLGAAAGAAWLGYFLFNPSRGTFSEQQIVVNISVPEHVQAGTEKEYAVRIQNTSSRDIAAAEVSIRGPQGFYITAADPVAVTPKNERWTLGAIASNGEKIIHLKGVYVGDSGTSGVLRTIVSYRPSNFNADFEKVTDSTVAVETNAATLGVQSTGGDKGATYTITYANGGTDAIANAQLTADVGNDVTITKTTPAAQISGTTVTLTIPELKAISTSTLIIVTAPKTNAAPLPYATPRTVTLARLIGDTSLTLAQTTLSASVTGTAATPAGGGLALTTHIQNAQALHAGDVIPFTLQYTNTTGASIKNATLLVSVEAPSVNNKSVFDFTNLETTGDPLALGKQISSDRRTATITWEAKDVPELAELAPGAHISLLFTLHVKTVANFAPFPAGGTATVVASLKSAGANDVSAPSQFGFAAQ